MELLNLYKYKKPNINRIWLKKYNFTHQPNLSYGGEDVYFAFFPVYKWGDVTTLECRLTALLPSGEIRIDVFDLNSGGSYAPFYWHDDNIHDSILARINKNIKNRLKKIGVKQVNENKKIK